MDAYKAINDILVHLFNEIWELEEKAVITEEYKDITNNDMHIIEAVGLGKGNNMSAIAKKLKITVGSLTTSMNSLVNKKYVVRMRSEEDRRVVNIRLTKKGEKAYRHHENFHKKMTEAVVASLKEDEIPVLVKTLHSLYDFFDGYRDEESQ
ncbi:MULTISPECIES: MarR family winged helix-turn-helix transcriptional regulator [Sellimonas]|uniref:HTH-type transcriptional regulator SarZ n=1 Tax=Sellimonas caecigallum TaxID=2592333 RepID=A0ABS7L5A7_9FIRM|nr:MarR family transcriptional regulator [Sellimonas sp.]MBY0758215.1 winged helix DNA-binding protein [Sellimonas caecigallum]OUP01269.1 MarR family transcriptional regulator [Drancourtella sp. An210]OUP67061.1 MarR family transcriptional regulator [Drancourtella sp. An177]